MTQAEQLYPQWIANKGIIKHEDVVVLESPTHQPYVWVRCPCGVKGHLGYWPKVGKDMSDVITCFESRQQWLVKPERDLPGIIYDEEASFIKLLESSPALVNKVSAKRGISEQTVAFLKDTHGVPKGISRGIMGLPEIPSDED